MRLLHRLVETIWSMPNLHEQACYYLLIMCPTVPVVDKMFQLHECCAIASSMLLLVCASCQWIVGVVFSLLQFYAIANKLSNQCAITPLAHFTKLVMWLCWNEYWQVNPLTIKFLGTPDCFLLTTLLVIIWSVPTHILLEDFLDEKLIGNYVHVIMTWRDQSAGITWSKLVLRCQFILMSVWLCWKRSKTGGVENLGMKQH